MNTKISSRQLSIALIAGSIWGLGEVALGAGLKACATMMSGSLMTGAALFFIAASWAASRNLLVPLLAVVVASLFKLFDAVLLSLPVLSGAIGNPIFAFILEGLAFVALIMIFKNVRWKRSFSALLGGGTALIAVALFPLVGFATGVPACLYPGSALPTAIVFGPIAIALSTITVPLGIFVGERLSDRYESWQTEIQSKLSCILLSPATAAMSIILILVFRSFVA